MNTSVDPADLFGYEVTDTTGNKIGKVDNVWVDDATSALEFVGVKTGWLMGKTHIIPTADAQISGDTVTIPYDQDRVKNAPSFSGDEELSPTQEDEVYSYYGVQRSTAPSPTGLAGDTGTTDTGYVDTGVDTGYATTGTGVGDDTVTLHEEQLQVGKREVETGRIRLRKVVRTERQEVPVDLRREDVEIERVPASGTAATTDAFQEREIEVPLTREEPVVAKDTFATEQARVRKTADIETQTVGGDVRTEELEVDSNVDTDRGIDRTDLRP